MQGRVGMSKEYKVKGYELGEEIKPPDGSGWEVAGYSYSQTNSGPQDIVLWEKEVDA